MKLNKNIIKTVVKNKIKMNASISLDLSKLIEVKEIENAELLDQIENINQKYNVIKLRNGEQEEKLAAMTNDLSRLNESTYEKEIELNKIFKKFKRNKRQNILFGIVCVVVAVIIIAVVFIILI